MKNKAKGTLTLLLIALLSFTLFACTGGGGTGNTSEPSGESKGESAIESVVESESVIESEVESKPEESTSESEVESSPVESTPESEVESKPEESTSESQSSSEDNPVDKSGEIFIRVYFNLSAPYEETIGVYGENMALTEVFEYIAEESSVTYAGEMSLDTFAVYNIGMEIVEETYFEGWGNYLCIINKEIISTSETFTVTYSGTDNYGNPIQGSFETGITYFENVFYMMGLSGSFSDYYFTVYGGTVGAMDESQIEKADVWASMIFAPTEIIVHPLVLVTVQIEDSSYVEFRYRSAPTLLTVIQDMQMETEKDDFLWKVGGSVVTDYSVVIPTSGENWIEARQKRIGAYVSFVDEFGNTITFDPMRDYCVLGDKATVGDLLMTSGMPDGEYTWELCYINENGISLSTPVTLSDEVKFVYTPDFDSYGFYRVEIYGKTSSLRIEYSGWLADKGDIWGSISYSDSVTVGQFLEDLNLGITLDDVYLTVNHQGYGGGVEDASYEISSPCTVSFSEKRPYVQVRGIGDNGEMVTKYLFMPSGEYTVGQAVSDAGFDYDSFFWEIQRYNNNNMYTETISVTDRNFLLVNDDEIIAKTIESVQVWFDCYEYGWVEVGDGGGSATYGVGAKWDNPQMFFSGDCGRYFVFEGWSFEKREAGDSSDVEIITSLDQIFAKGQEMITVFPVFKPNYESLSGWWGLNMDGNPAYVNILNESELLIVTNETEEITNFTVSLQYSQVYVTLEGGNIGYFSFVLETSGTRPTCPIFKIITEYEDGMVDVWLFEGEQEFRNHLSYEGYTLKSFTLDGVEVDTDELLTDAYYVAVFSYAE